MWRDLEILQIEMKNGAMWRDLEILQIEMKNSGCLVLSFFKLSILIYQSYYNYFT